MRASPNLTHLEDGKRAKEDSSLEPFEKNHFRMNCPEAGCLRQDPSWGEWQSVQFNSVAQLYPTLCDPMDYSTPGFPIRHQLLELTLKLMSIELVMPSSHLILCRPLLLLPSIFPSIRVFSSESVLASRGQSFGVSASASVLPMNIQD